MDAQILVFFDGHIQALPIYERLESMILNRLPYTTVKVTKSQISFSKKHGFAFVSFNPCRKAKDRPETWMTVTFGLGYRKEAPRIDVAVEPYPNRWTHHVMVGALEEIDEELLSWIEEAADFAVNK